MGRRLAPTLRSLSCAPRRKLLASIAAVCTPILLLFRQKSGEAQSLTHAGAPGSTAEQGFRRERGRQPAQVLERNKPSAAFRDFQYACRKRADSAASTAAFSFVIRVLAVLPCPEPPPNPYATL